MSKVNCEAVGKRRQASLRMARAELLHVIRAGWYFIFTNADKIAIIIGNDGYLCAIILTNPQDATIITWFVKRFV